MYAVTKMHGNKSLALDDDDDGDYGIGNNWRFSAFFFARVARKPPNIIASLRG